MDIKRYLKANLPVLFFLLLGFLVLAYLFASNAVDVGVTPDAVLYLGALLVLMGSLLAPFFLFCVFLNSVRLAFCHWLSTCRHQVEEHEDIEDALPRYHDIAIDCPPNYYDVVGNE
jgi:hypothetical protein